MSSIIFFKKIGGAFSMTGKNDTNIIRVKKGKRPFVVLDKCFIYDPRLSVARAVEKMLALANIN